MSYVRPEQVLSPRNLVGGVLEVIHDPGENRMSVARILWDKEEVVASRWMDEYAAAKVEEAARAAAEQSPNSLIAKYREMANDSDREREAEEWSQGLIGDVSAQR